MLWSSRGPVSLFGWYKHFKRSGDPVVSCCCIMAMLHAVYFGRAKIIPLLSLLSPSLLLLLSHFWIVLLQWLTFNSSQLICTKLTHNLTLNCIFSVLHEVQSLLGDWNVTLDYFSLFHHRYKQLTTTDNYSDIQSDRSYMRDSTIKDIEETAVCLTKRLLSYKTHPRVRGIIKVCI